MLYSSLVGHGFALNCSRSTFKHDRYPLKIERTKLWSLLFFHPKCSLVDRNIISRIDGIKRRKIFWSCFFPENTIRVISAISMNANNVCIAIKGKKNWDSRTYDSFKRGKFSISSIRITVIFIQFYDKSINSDCSSFNLLWFETRINPSLKLVAIHRSRFERE